MVRTRTSCAGCNRWLLFLLLFLYDNVAGLDGASLGTDGAGDFFKPIFGLPAFPFPEVVTITSPSIPESSNQRSRSSEFQVAKSCCRAESNLVHWGQICVEVGFCLRFDM